MKLTDTAIRNAKPTPRLIKLSDGGGLQLWVTPTGSKLWRLAYRSGGKQKKLSIGPYPGVSLRDAREKRDQAKRQLRDGVDPNHHRRQARLHRTNELENTFNAIADEYMSKLARERRAEATINKNEWLLNLARPRLGKLPITDITAPKILTVLRDIEMRGRHETARRLRSTIGSVFRYAIATARATSDPTIALHGALTAPAVKPRAAITNPEKFGALLRAVDSFDGQPTTRTGLQLMALLFPRPGELRLAEWSEFDLRKGIWIIPAPRMKMRRPHRTPLSRQSVAVLKRLHQITGNGRLVFPSVRSLQRPISDNTLNAALRRLGYSQDEATAHGFRATASTLLNECGRWNADAIERQLAHIEASEVRRAYARGEHWDERVKMMQWWADQLDIWKVGIFG